MFPTDGGANTTYTTQVFTQATQSSSTSITVLSSSMQLINATGGAVTLTLPSASSSVNKVFYIKKVDSSGNAGTVAAASVGDTIENASTYSLPNQYNSVMIQSNGVSNWNVLGSVITTSGFAPTDATYITLSANATLTNERVLTAGKNVFITDAGANSTVTVEVNALTSTTSATTNLLVTSNSVLIVDASGGAKTVNLPAATSPKEFIIKKLDSSVNAVTVNRAGSDVIDGATSYALVVQYQALDIISDGSGNWNII